MQQALSVSIVFLSSSLYIVSISGCATDIMRTLPAFICCFCVSVVGCCCIRNLDYFLMYFEFVSPTFLVAFQTYGHWPSILLFCKWCNLYIWLGSILSWCPLMNLHPHLQQSGNLLFAGIGNIPLFVGNVCVVVWDLCPFLLGYMPDCYWFFFGFPFCVF